MKSSIIVLLAAAAGSALTHSTTTTTPAITPSENWLPATTATLLARADKNNTATATTKKNAVKSTQTNEIGMISTATQIVAAPAKFDISDAAPRALAGLVGMVVSTMAIVAAVLL